MKYFRHVFVNNFFRMKENRIILYSTVHSPIFDSTRISSQPKKIKDDVSMPSLVYLWQEFVESDTRQATKTQRVPHIYNVRT